MREGEPRSARNGETSRYSVLNAGTVPLGELRWRVWHVSQQQFDGNVAPPTPVFRFWRIQKQVTWRARARSLHPSLCFCEVNDETKQKPVASSVAGTRRIAP